MAVILLADDDLTTQLILQQVLEEQGHRIETAENGKSALTLAEKIIPDLIVCDWMMPEMDGLEVCQHIKGNSHLSTTFFILLTAREQVHDRVMGLDAGADDFIAKPIEIEEFLARVRAGLRIQSLNQKLSQTNQQLSQALSNLKRAQVRLIQSEKMSSLGQMVAGIAHEINNPISFILGNLNYATQYAEELIEIIDLYHENIPDTPETIQKKIEEIELEFITQDFPKVLDSMKQGADRIHQIIQSLRNFARLDEAQRKSADIHQGIDNTLLILQNRLNSATFNPIQVIKNYGIIPLVDCYPGQLNQVFLNLLNNAIESLEKKQQKHPQLEPKIWIKTENISQVSSPALSNSKALITIRDNGVGIAKEIKNKIFDPFFTTKPVGSGMGLGLSVCYEIIVQQHQGQITVKTEPGEAAEFILEIPI